MAISGAQVPKETIVKAINILGTFNFKARELAASTKISEALIIRIKPAIKKRISMLYQLPLYFIISITDFFYSYNQEKRKKTLKFSSLPQSSKILPVQNNKSVKR